MEESVQIRDPRAEKLEKAVEAVKERVRKMTKEEHIAVFQKIGVLDQDGKLTPEYSGLSVLLKKGA